MAEKTKQTEMNYDVDTFCDLQGVNDEQRFVITKAAGQKPPMTYASWLKFANSLYSPEQIFSNKFSNNKTEN